MKYIADLHIHSHFSRATSRNLNPENLALWAQKKGICVIGTGDFTHPGWIAELKDKLQEAEKGLFRLRPDLELIVGKEIPETCKRPARFILSSEISCIYKKNDRTRKIHHLILMPDFDAAERLNKALDRIGNIKSDGRPILGLDSRNLLEMVLEADERAFFIPAHVWTPWFSLFGSKSGFDVIEECFEDLTPHICALETGLSSDPPMNRLLSQLDKYLLVSNSDAHSPAKLGREANIFDTDLDYDHMIQAMSQQDGFIGTIEFYPEEGKYHLDGHRKCEMRLSPEETRKYNGICPVCGKAVTVGVLNRVSELADRESPILSKDFFSLIPLAEIFSEILGCGPGTKKVTTAYEDLLTTLGPELQILMDISLNDIERAGSLILAKAIERMRKNQVIRQEGYDGEYGIIRLFEESEKAELTGQTSLFKNTKKRLIQKAKPLPVKKLDALEPELDIDPNKKNIFDPILDPLNPEQREVVLYRGSHLLITAGPGTGKTMTLTHRIAHIIRSESVIPEMVLALTFTNKAARELKDRLNKLLGPEKSEKMKIMTFHGFCLEVLRNEGGRTGIPEGFQLISEGDISILSKYIISGFGLSKKISAKVIRAITSDRMIEFSDDSIKKSEQEIQLFLQKYREVLRSMGMLGLDQLQGETLRLFRDYPDVCREYSSRYPKIFIDEYQDTNPIQVAILKELYIEGDNEVCAIGDPDQAIYGFRGADVNNFYRFTKDFPGARDISLSKNYRSTEVILESSSRILGKEKVLEGMTGKGVPVQIGQCATHSEEAEMVVEQIEKMLGGTSYFSLDSGRVASHEDGDEAGFGDIAVLFRLNAQGEALETAFSRAGIPYVRSGEKPLIRQYPANIIIRYLQTCYSPDNEYFLNAYENLLKDGDIKPGKLEAAQVADKSIVDHIDRAITIHGIDTASGESNEALKKLREYAVNFNGDMRSFLDTLSLERGIDHSMLAGDRVVLMSIHAAKGLEWPIVFITGCEDKLIPCSLFGEQDESEGKRLLYVGMTRARRMLILSHVAKRNINGRYLEMKVSPFLDLIPKELMEPLKRAKWKRKRKGHQQLDLFTQIG